MSDDGAVQCRGQTAVRGAKLPDRHPDRMWGGPGAGTQCAICDAAIEPREPEWELEFVQYGAAPEKYHVHPRCFLAWQVELRNVVLASGATS